MDIMNTNITQSNPPPLVDEIASTPGLSYRQRLDLLRMVAEGEIEKAKDLLNAWKG